MNICYLIENIHIHLNKHINILFFHLGVGEITSIFLYLIFEKIKFCYE